MRPQQQNRRMRGRNNNNNSNNNNNNSNNNNNNNRRGPNPLTRTYESNGPDVKIRGSAQQIAEKYATLARDAQSSGDRVMAENYLQHAEHYNRIIAAAQAQMPAQNFQQPRNELDDDLDDEGGDDFAAQSNGNGGQGGNGMQQPHVDGGSGPQPEIDGTPAEVALNPEAVSVEGDGAADDQPRLNGGYQVNGADGDQAAPRRPRRPRRSRGRRGEGDADNADAAGEPGDADGNTLAAAEAPAQGESPAPDNQTFEPVEN